MNEIKVLELFGGIGALTKAFKRLEIPHKVIDYVEIDKYAVASYNAINGTNFEPQDVCEWDKDIEVDLLMHGSPCQDFSLAGLQKSGDKGSGTRSSLMWETIRIVEKLKPKYVIWENVKNLLSKKHRHNFDAYLEAMEQLGYTNYYQVLNAKDYGIPQNRERVFTISILKENPMIIGSLQAHASKRIDGICPTLTSAMGMGGGQTPVIIENTQIFEFPPKQELKLKLKDMLENEVDEKYYLSDEWVKKIKYKYENNTICETRYDEGIRTFKDNICGSLRTIDAGGNKCVIQIKNTTKKGYQEACENVVVNKTVCLNSKSGRNGIEGLQPSLKDRIYDSNGIATCCATSNFFMPNYTDGLRIRKLTSKECWRLMGFDDEDFEKAEKVNSNTQLYKQAGNSIVVNVLEAILINLLLNQKELESD